MGIHSRGKWPRVAWKTLRNEVLSEQPTYCLALNRCLLNKLWINEKINRQKLLWMLHFYFITNVLFSQALGPQKDLEVRQKDFFSNILYFFPCHLISSVFWVTIVIKHYTFYTRSELGLLESFTFFQRIHLLEYASVKICRKKKICLIPFASALDPSPLWIASSLSNFLHIDTLKIHQKKKFYSKLLIKEYKKILLVNKKPSWKENYGSICQFLENTNILNGTMKKLRQIQDVEHSTSYLNLIPEKVSGMR